MNTVTTGRNIRSLTRILMAAILCLAWALPLLTSQPVYAVSTTTDLSSGLTPADLVDALLADDAGLTIVDGSIMYTGDDVAAGTFSGGVNSIGFESGIILGTGRVDRVIGASPAVFASTLNSRPGDPDLDGVIAPYTSNDAAVLEFDFVPDEDQVSFIYVFASEEYNGFVYKFSDGFAFFVNGVNYAEITTIDGTRVPVTIDTINGGNPLGTNPQNATYYRNNVCADGPCVNAATSMNGLTAVLTLRAPVNQGVSNHLKMVIGDAMDYNYDSNIFIKAQSLTCRQADLSLQVTVDNYAPAVGSNVTFDVTVANAGSYAANEVKVKASLPSGLTFVSAMPSQGVYDSVTGIWIVGTLNRDANATLRIVATVTVKDEIKNTVQVIDSHLPDPDSTPNNNVPGEDDWQRITLNALSDGAPTGVSLSDNIVNENSAQGTFVGYLGTTDPDADDAHVYALVDDAGGRFATDGSRLEVADSSLLDYESDACHTITVRTTDCGGLSYDEALTITVVNVNDAPLANDDTIDTSEDTPVTIDVLGNDSDPDDGDTLTLIDVGRPANGSARINSSMVVYTPTQNFDNSDTFTYTVCDGSLTNSATVTVTVNPVNDAPVAADDSFSVEEDAVLTGTSRSVLDNDSDIDSALLTAVLDSGPADGTLRLNPDGTFIYTPASSFDGADTFIYHANDGVADSNTATVRIEQSRNRCVYLPLVSRNYLSAPDLVVDDIIATSNSLQVIIRNQGNAAVVDEFWVDVYIDPRPVPTGVNQVWYDGRSTYGLVWGVTASALPALEPGGMLTLTVEDDYYWADLSRISWPLPAGTPVYAQVDAANVETTYGGVLESHEIAGGAYNNVESTVSAGSIEEETLSLTGNESPPTLPGRLPGRPQDISDAQ